MPSGSRHRGRSRALAAALGLLASLLLLEAVVRVLDLGPTFHVVHRETVRASDDPALVYELRPGAPDGASHISRTGLRDGEHPLEKPEGVFRIAAIGDSVTYGLGVTRDASWPARLESLLNGAAGDEERFEVLNLGVPGYHAGQVVARLRDLGLDHDPDLVVYGYVLNDPQASSLQAEAVERLRDEASEHFHRPGALRVLAGSRLFLWLRHLAETPPALRDPEPGLDPALAAKQDDTLAAYLRDLHTSPGTEPRWRGALDQLGRVGRKRNVPVVLAIFPVLGEGRGRDYPLADLHALVAEAARRSGLEALDLRRPLERVAAQRGRLHLDFLHPNAAGHQVAAAALHLALCARELVPSEGCAPSR